MKEYTVSVKRNMLYGIVLFFVSAVFFAQTPAPAIDDIIKRLDDNTVFDTAISEATVTVQNKFGTTYNDVRTYGRKNGDTLIEIISGPDRGQKVLRLANSIYLYYPDAEEVIRLQGSALKDSMMGSDFSYEDLTGDKSIASNYTSEYLGTETIDGRQCYHLMLTAKKKTAAYQKEELFVDTEKYVSLKSILYSASGKALREMTSSDIMQINGKYIAQKSVMVDLLKKTSVTTMQLKKIEVNAPIQNKYFTLEELSW